MLCYIHRSAVLVHPNGRNKTYLYSYNKITHVRNVIIDNGMESIEKEGRTPLNIKLILEAFIELGYYVKESKNLNNGLYTYDLAGVIEI